MSPAIGFIGKHELRIDDKGRLTIPARYKTVLKEQYPADDMQVVVSPSLDLTLTVQPLSEFRKMLDEFERYNDLDEETRRLKEILIGRATLERVDAGGRIRLSADLRDLAGLSRDVVCIGANRAFGIWDAGRWSETERHTLGNLKQLAEQVRLKNRTA